MNHLTNIKSAFENFTSETADLAENLQSLLMRLKNAEEITPALVREIGDEVECLIRDVTNDKERWALIDTMKGA